jgi:hypothetical protein
MHAERAHVGKRHRWAQSDFSCEETGARCNRRAGGAMPQWVYLAGPQFMKQMSALLTPKSIGPDRHPRPLLGSGQSRRNHLLHLLALNVIPAMQPARTAQITMALIARSSSLRSIIVAPRFAPF